MTRHLQHSPSKLTLADLDAISEALAFRCAGEIDPAETDGIEAEAYHSAQDKIARMIAGRRATRSRLAAARAVTRG